LTLLFQNGRLKVRELEPHDAELMAKWLSDPAILEFYEGRDNVFDHAKVIEVFFSPDPHEKRCMVIYEDTPIGYLQFYELEQENRDAFGLDKHEAIFGTDQFIGEQDYWNRGIGQQLMKSVVNYLIEEQGADRIVVDPQTWNERAIACYEKSGFKKKKLLHKHEWHEGEYRDSWLMEFNSSH
jgi:aminoglycoside 6'-N-acetyltransferase